MTRQNSLLRLSARLIARRNALRKTFADDFEGLRNGLEANAVADSLDAAVGTATGEITSQMVELESRELAQIEHALCRISQGTYGRCESCGCRIPAARLSVLPYASCCIDCQRASEQSGTRTSPAVTSPGWGKLYESVVDEGAGEPRINWSDLTRDASGSRSSVM